MTTMAPAAARALWLALLDNAARIVVEADALFPSPRAQSLVVLAQEEVGKAIWVRKAFWNAWYGDDETSREVPELHSQWRAHSAKLMAATDYYTAVMEVPGSPKPVDIELVWAHAPEVVVAYLKQTALEDNQAKQKGFYVDPRPAQRGTVRWRPRRRVLGVSQPFRYRDASQSRRRPDSSRCAEFPLPPPFRSLLRSC